MRRTHLISRAIVGLAIGLLATTHPLAALAASPSSAPTPMASASTGDQGIPNLQTGVIANGPCCRAHADVVDLVNPETGVIQQDPCCRAHGSSADLLNPETGVIATGPCCRAHATSGELLNPESGVISQGPCRSCR
jgi:hypothetical protein